MSTLTITNMPPKLYKQLQQSARKNQRSLDDELLIRLENSFARQLNKTEAFLEKLERLQKKISTPRLTNEILKQAREEGCP